MSNQSTSHRKTPRQFSWRATAAVVWLVISVTLATWWVIFGLDQIDRISQLEGAAPQSVASEIARRHRMLMSEGATLILLLIGGGVALLWHVLTEARRARAFKEFFAAFTHDLKTSLASLRLQVESLEEDSGNTKLMKRLVKDTVRLELQLENSLLLASPDDNSRFFLESIRLSDVLQPMIQQWPDLNISLTGDANVWADQRAVESIFKNLFQNSLIHGRASRVEVTVRTAQDGRVLIHVSDNGRGFQGDLGRLGRIFERHGSSSGSGLGLYLATNLASRLGGALQFLGGKKGFNVEVSLPVKGDQ